MATSDKLAEMTAAVVEETGVQCAICHEGPRAAPTEELGIYVFIRRCLLEEGLSQPTGSTSGPSTASLGGGSTGGNGSKCPDGFTTVSSFVLVHYHCHNNVSAMGVVCNFSPPRFLCPTYR